MRVVYKNPGKYADYSLNDSVLTLRGGELSIDLAEHSRDYPVSLDISEDISGMLTLGCSRRYVAELNIPARISSVEKTGVADDFGFPVLRRVYAPFSTDNIVLTLWAERED